MDTQTNGGNLMDRLAATYLHFLEIAHRPIDHARNRGEAGQGMVEYALILVLIAIAAVLMLTTVGKQAKNVFSNVSSGLAA